MKAGIDLPELDPALRKLPAPPRLKPGEPQAVAINRLGGQVLACRQQLGAVIETVDDMQRLLERPAE